MTSSFFADYKQSVGCYFYSVMTVDEKVKGTVQRGLSSQSLVK